jgi:hypothetical protein
MPEEHLDIQQLTTRIPFSRRTIEYLIASDQWIEGVHAKRFFLWTRVEAWIRGELAVWAHRLYSQAKRNAAKRKIAFELSPDELAQIVVA